MSFLPTLRASIPKRVATSVRTISSTPTRFTTAGYGDPQDEKMANETPGIKQQSTTAPEMKSHSGTETSSGSSSKGGKGEVKSQGGAEGAGDKGKEDVSAKDIRETKKIGSEPKNTEEGGAGPKGG
jgi:hypothetical protein